MKGIKSNRRIGLYMRVSTEKQAKVEEGSLKNQKQILVEEIKRRNSREKNWGTLVEEYIDEGISAKNTNRKQFQRMLKDVENGRITAIMFTDLSRFSRSLRDFLNIFEFVSSKNCDLICLKTEIDTTSPYSALVTKILMIFAEFEREVTGDRVKQNAYERSKRGLANGGREVLGYNRHPTKKGHLVIVPEEAKIVKEIYRLFIKGMKRVDIYKLIKEKYGHLKKLKTMPQHRILSILENKQYIAVRVITPHDPSRTMEVPAVWKPILTKDIFDKAQKKLKLVKKMKGEGQIGKYQYPFSSLIFCSWCGSHLKGSRSRVSTTGEEIRYYIHPTKCKQGGINSLEVPEFEKLIYSWLESMVYTRAKWNEYETKIKESLDQKISMLNKEYKKTKDEKTENDINTLKSYKTNKEFFKDLRKSIKMFLVAPEKEKKIEISDIISRIDITDEGFKIQALPLIMATGKIDLLNETIPLFPKDKVKSKAFMEHKLIKEKLSVKDLAKEIGVTTWTIRKYAKIHNISYKIEIPLGNKVIPYGWNYKGRELVENKDEQKVLEIAQQLVDSGHSGTEIAKILNSNLIPTKRGGLWYSASVYKILSQKEKMLLWLQKQRL